MKTPNDASIIFFSDLDGTLLNHQTYSFAPAVEALSALREHNIPLILASSKTAAEITSVRSAIGFDEYPAIVENGAGILQPSTSDGFDDKSYQHLLDEISNVSPHHRKHFLGFSQMSVEHLSKLTGLTIEDALLAKKRQYSEPGIWSGDRDTFDHFATELNNKGISMQKGGRFVTLSFGGNKAERMKSIRDSYLNTLKKIFCVALGDAPNDVAMLKTADLGIIVSNPAHEGINPLPAEKSGQIIRTLKNGPRGWNDAVLNILSDAGLGG